MPAKKEDDKTAQVSATSVKPTEVVPPEKEKSKASKTFVIALSVVSIIGFLSIMFNTLFYINLDAYMSTAWLITLGLGLVFETSIKELKMIKQVGLTPEMLGKITMEIVGGIAIIAGIISLPQINLQNPSFLAVKGIISILGIIFIIINTWVTESD